MSRSNLASSCGSATTAGDGEARASARTPGREATGRSPARQPDERPAGPSQRVPAHRVDEGAQGVLDDPLRGTPSAVRERQTGGSESATVRTRPSSAPFSRGSQTGLGPIGARRRLGRTRPGGHDLEGQGGQHGEGRHGGARMELGRPHRPKASATSSAAEGSTEGGHLERPQPGAGLGSSPGGFGPDQLG